MSVQVYELTLDGFKSWKKKAVFTGFHESFNAITGQNGSGKSNIFDALLFVLGGQIGERLRVKGKRELVNAKGNGGVSCATVILRVLVIDKSRIPEQWQHLDRIEIKRQIAIPEVEKCYIGEVGKPKTVSLRELRMFFQNLNVNAKADNLTFVIQQGTIARVAKKKPSEILRQIAEATGATMWENAVQEHDKKVEKWTKLQEQSKPQVEEAKKRHAENFKRAMNHEKKQKNDIELKRLRRVDAAHTYWMAKTGHERAAAEEDRWKTERQTAKEEKATTAERQKELTEAHEKKKAEAESLSKDEDSAFKRAEKVRDAARLEKKTAETNLTEKKKETDKLESARKKRDVELETKEAKHAADKTLLEKMAEDVQQKKENLEANIRAQKQQQEAVEKGNAVDAQTWEDGRLLPDAENYQQDRKNEAEMKINSIAPQAEELREKLKEAEHGAKNSRDVVRQKQKDLEVHVGREKVLLRELNTMDYSEEKEQKMRTDLQNAKTHNDHAHRELRDIETRLKEARQFLPTENVVQEAMGNIRMSRDLWKGHLCELFSLKAEYKQYESAFESTFKGQFRNILVQTDAAARELVQRRALPTRETFLPLDKVRGDTPALEKLHAARRAIGDTGRGEPLVIPAIEMIDFDPVNTPAMRNVFGSTFFCLRREDAQKVVASVKLNAASADGNIYRSSGITEGGQYTFGDVVNLGNDRRVQTQRLIASDSKIREIQNELSSNDFRSQQRKFRDLWGELESTRMMIGTLKDELGNNVADRSEDINKMKEHLSGMEAQLREAVEQKRDAQRVIEAIRDRKKEVTRDADKMLEKARKDLEKNAKKKEELEKKIEKAVQDLEKKEVEVQATESEISDLKASQETDREEVNSKRKEIENLQAKVQEVAGTLEEAEKKFQEEKDMISARHKEVDQLRKDAKEAEKKVEKLEVQLQKLEENIKRAKIQKDQYEKDVKEVLRKEEWLHAEIEREPCPLGMSGGEFDFERESKACRDLMLVHEEPAPRRRNKRRAPAAAAAAAADPAESAENAEGEGGEEDENAGPPTDYIKKRIEQLEQHTKDLVKQGVDPMAKNLVEAGEEKLKEWNEQLADRQAETAELTEQKLEQDEAAQIEMKRSIQTVSRYLSEIMASLLPHSHACLECEYADNRKTRRGRKPKPKAKSKGGAAAAKSKKSKRARVEAADAEDEPMLEEEEEQRQGEAEEEEGGETGDEMEEEGEDILDTDDTRRLDGVKFKFGFTDAKTGKPVWKKNLGELSGGQRSLLSLAFVLALLKKDPSPIYILDEIDSALDMNNTGNIGNMIKQNFPQSQFFIISLKEGMWKHANVLFKIRFLNEASAFERVAIGDQGGVLADVSNRHPPAGRVGGGGGKGKAKAIVGGAAAAAAAAAPIGKVKGGARGRKRVAESEDVLASSDEDE